MIETAIFLEGQNGLTWPKWQRLAQAVEDLGFSGFYRSDHFTNAQPPDKDSLECWVSLTWLASHTKRIEFGPLVSPISFRHPTFLARMASSVDDLSGGRLSLGLGAGWQEREHNNYGFELLNKGDRFDRFEEGVEVISKLLNSEDPVNYQGEYFRIQEGILLPRPNRPGGPPILIGGNGRQKTLPLAARFAAEWNALMNTSEQFNELNQHMDELLVENGRKPSDVRRSMMVACIFADDENQLRQRVTERTGGKRTLDELRQRGFIVGTANQMVEQLGELSAAGVQRVMLQWIDLDDVNGLESIAKDVLPQLKD